MKGIDYMVNKARKINLKIISIVFCVFSTILQGCICDKTEEIIQYPEWLSGTWTCEEFVLEWNSRLTDWNYNTKAEIGRKYDFEAMKRDSFCGGVVPIRDTESQSLFFPALYTTPSLLNMEEEYFSIVDIAEAVTDESQKIGNPYCLIVLSLNEMLIAKNCVGAFRITRDTEVKYDVYDRELTFEENIKNRIRKHGISYNWYYLAAWSGHWTIKEVIYSDNRKEAEKCIGEIVEYPLIPTTVNGENNTFFDIHFWSTKDESLFYKMPTIDELGMEGRYYVIAWNGNSEYPAAILKNEHEIYLIKGNTIYKGVQEEEYLDVLEAV